MRMNDKFFFYVCDNEFRSGVYKGFAGDEEHTPNAVGFKYLHGTNSSETMNVIVVDGEVLTAKQEVLDHYNAVPQVDPELSSLICKYFKALEKIAQHVFKKCNFGVWQPKHVTVITHWGGDPVDARENDFAKAVNAIVDKDKQKWKTVASSSTRQEAFPKGFNPFVTTGNAANLPTAAVCEILEMNLPLAGKIDWEDVEKTTDEAELKRYYDRLMLKLNH